MRKSYAGSYPNNERAALQAALDLLCELSEAELAVLAGAIQAHQHLDSMAPAGEDEEYQTVTMSEASSGGAAVRLEWKLITRNGKEHGPYPYLRWFENGVHKSKYMRRRK